MTKTITNASIPELLHEIIKRSNLEEAPARIDMYVPFFITTIPISDDYTADILLDADSKHALDELMEEVGK